MGGPGAGQGAGCLGRGARVWDDAGGTCAYTKYLFQVPIVVTANMSTEHLEYLESPEAHDFLGREENRAVLRLTQRRA